MNPENNNHKNSFYIAVILYESSSTEPNYQPLYQEGFVLIKANSLEEASKKAWNYGLKEQVSYQNENQDTITWLMKEIIDVNSVLYDEFEDGTEIYARHFQNYEAYKQLDI